MPLSLVHLFSFFQTRNFNIHTNTKRSCKYYSILLFFSTSNLLGPSTLMAECGIPNSFTQFSHTNMDAPMCNMSEWEPPSCQSEAGQDSEMNTAIHWTSSFYCMTTQRTHKCQNKRKSEKQHGTYNEKECIPVKHNTKKL